MAAPTIRNKTNGTSTASSFAPTLPAHQADDLIVIIVHSEKQLNSASNSFVITAGNINGYYTNIITKKATSASETTTLTFGSGGDLCWAAYSISGVDFTQSPLGIADYDYQEKANLSTYQQGNIWCVYRNALLINFLGGDNSATYTTTTTLNSWTEDADLALARAQLWVGSITISTQGAITGPSNAVSDSTFNAHLGTLHIIGTGELPTRNKVKAFQRDDGSIFDHTVTALAQLVFRNVNYDWVFVMGEGWDLTAGSTLGVTSPGGLDWRYLGSLASSGHLAFAKLDNTATSANVTWGTASDYGCVGFVVRGAHPTRPFSKFGWEKESASATSHTVPALSPIDNGELHVAIWQFNSDETLTTAPSGYTQELEHHDSTNGSCAFVYSKSSYNQGDTTSATLVSSTGSCYHYSLLINTPYASAIPAQVLSVTDLPSSPGAYTWTEYQQNAKTGDLLVLLDFVISPTGESAMSITTPAGLTHVPVISEYSLTYGWSAHAQVARLTSDLAGTVAVNNPTDVGNSHYAFLAIVNGSHETQVGAAETVDVDGTSDTYMDISLPISDGCVLGLGIIQANSTPTGFDTSNTVIATSSGWGWAVGVNNNPVPSGGAVADRMNYISTTAHGYFMQLGFGRPKGGAGLVFGSDF